MVVHEGLREQFSFKPILNQYKTTEAQWQCHIPKWGVEQMSLPHVVIKDLMSRWKVLTLETWPASSTDNYIVPPWAGLCRAPAGHFSPWTVREPCCEWLKNRTVQLKFSGNNLYYGDANLRVVANHATEKLFGLLCITAALLHPSSPRNAMKPTMHTSFVRQTFWKGKCIVPSLTVSCFGRSS